MFLVRDVFKCKPGQAKVLIEKFKKSMALLESGAGFNGFRILVDYVASYWTVVLESEVENLAQFDQHMREWGERADVQEVMRGYMDSVESGYREIFRIA
jgi:heme-degrading monooxygenase HmoA